MIKLINILKEITIKSQSKTFKELMEKIDELYYVKNGEKWNEFMDLLNKKYKRFFNQSSLDWTDYIYYELRDRWNELYVDVLKIINKK